MPKKGELSKTARASLALGKNQPNHATKHLCASCNDVIWSDDIFPVKVLGKGMVFYHKDHYKLQ
jgi:hypothetical protein